eukprot:1096957-Heterocapsa_arctica.AAC.1
MARRRSASLLRSASSDAADTSAPRRARLPRRRLASPRRSAPLGRRRRSRRSRRACGDAAGSDFACGVGRLASCSRGRRSRRPRGADGEGSELADGEA